MKIGEVFAYPIDREITSVIKVDDLSLREVAQEIEEYVVTESIEESLLEFLDSYNSTRFQPTEKIGVWISGFFGSGKSHFAKMLGHLLKNQAIDGETAIEKFLVRIAGSIRANEIKRALHELQNSFNNLVVMFQIRSEAYGETEDITRIMYREFLKSRNLSSFLHVARVELELLREGKYEAFKKAILKLSGKSWEEVRESYLFNKPYIIKALFKLFPDRYTSEEQIEKTLDEIEEKYELSPSSLAEELLKYLAEEEKEKPEKTARLVFIVDEMGQFIGESNQKLLELQSIAEQFSSKGKGKIWLIVTSQEKLEEVIEGVGQRQTTFSKIIDRFDLRLEMTSENIEKVLEERILKKREAPAKTIGKMFTDHQGNIVNIATLQNASRSLPECNEWSFVKAYPFLPYQFNIMPLIFSSIRSKGGPATQLTGSERSMLGVTQGVIKSPKTGFKESDMGRVVALDEIYDQIENEIPTEIQRTISGADKALPNPSLPLSRLLKAIYLLQQVEWVPRDLENITRTVTATTDKNVTLLKEEIKEGLQRLVEGKYILPKEGQYEFLSGAKKNLMEEVSSVEVREGDRKRKAKEFLKIILTKDRVHYQGLRWFDFKVYGDEEMFSSKGDIELSAYSPILVQRDPSLERGAVLRQSLTPKNSLKIYWLAQGNSDVDQKITRLIQLEETLKRREGAVKSDEEKEILRELAGEAHTLKNSIESRFRDTLVKGIVIFDGDETEIDERIKDISIVIDKGVCKAIPKVYPKFDMAAYSVSEKSISEILRAPANILSEIESDVSLFDKNGQLNRHIKAVEEVFTEIKARVDKGISALGKDLIMHFEKVPYGWDPIFTRLIVTALFRDGAITLNYEGKVFRDFRKSDAQDLLVNSRKFNNTKLDYEEEVELTISDRQKVRAKLELILGKKLDDGINALASAIEDGLSRMVDEQKHLEIKSEGAGLPLYEELKNTEKITSPVLEYAKPHQRIKEFMGIMEKVEQIYKCQKKAREFAESEKLDEFRKLNAAKEKIESTLGYLELAEQNEIKEHIQEINQIVANKKVIESWREFWEHAQKFLAQYRKAYARLHNEAGGLYNGLIKEIKENSLFKGMSLKDRIKQIGERICEAEPKWGDDLVVCQQCRQSIEGLQLKIADFERFKRTIEKAILDEVNAKKRGKKIATLSLKSVVKTKRIEKKEHLDQALSEITEVVQKHLDNDEIVTLD